MGHTYLARAAGMDEPTVQALRAGDLPQDAKLAALSLFARAVVEKRGFVGDAAVDSFLAAGFTRANVLEVVTIAATKTISNYTNHITHTPKEGFMADPSLAWSAPGHRIAAE
jgi:alkylhydroperoxidase family enzyme